VIVGDQVPVAVDVEAGAGDRLGPCVIAAGLDLRDRAEKRCLLRGSRDPASWRRRQRAKTVTGSGFYIDRDGHLITNYHVVSKLVAHPDRYRPNSSTAPARHARSRCSGST